MSERFVPEEELDQIIHNLENAVFFYTCLKESIQNGDFVLRDDEKETYRVARKNMPIIPA